MFAPRPLLCLVLSALPSLAATFGTVVSRPQPIADLALNAAGTRLYVVNTASNQVEIYNTTVNPPRLANTIKTDLTPLAIALSRSERYLYVACYDGSSLDIVDLSSASFSTRSVTLAAKPESVAVGFDEKVLIGTIGTAQGQAVLSTYDPNADSGHALQAVVIAPPAPSIPQFPPPNGVAYLAGHSRLQASQDGTIIVGVNEQSSTRVVFVYDARSSTVLASRIVAAVSPILAISPDGSRFVSGPMLFDTSTLLVLAQQNAANAPFVYSTSDFTTQTRQGGAVFSPDGSALFAAYNIAPVLSPPARSNAGQLLVQAPDNLLVQLGLQLPETLSGKMAIAADGSAIYAISQSGFMVLPVGKLGSVPIAMPDSAVALLANDQCGVTAAQNSAVVPLRNAGQRQITATVQLLQTALSGNQSTATSPQVRATPKSYGADVTAQFNPAAARSLGTVAPDQLLIQSPEAVNIVPNVRVFQNNRNAEAQGTIVPLDTGATNAGLTDMLSDAARQRLYIANPGRNRIEVFDTGQQQFQAPIDVGQLPRSMAFGNDGKTLYVANGGGESISIVDLDQGAAVGRVKFPPLPFNAAVPPIAPQAIASSRRGPLVVMSDGTLWKIVGDTVVPRALNPGIFGAGARSIPGPVTMASSPEGGYVLILAGNGSAYLYGATEDDFIRGQQVIPTPIQGYYGPISAGPNGQYYLVNDQVLDQGLAPIGNPPGGTGPTPGGGLPLPGGPAVVSRPVSAVAAAGTQAFARFSMPVRAGIAVPATDAGLIELVDPASQRTLVTLNSLEGPLGAVAAGQRAIVSGRTMAVDPSGSAVYVLTASGLSIIPIPTGAQNPPQAPGNGVVSTASYLPSVAAGGLVSIFGRNLASTAVAGGTPLPTILGGTCVTLNNSPLPLLAAGAGQINAELPPALAAGRYPLVVRSVAGQAASASVTVAVSKYAPAVFVDTQGPAIFHKDGTRVGKDHPGKRDEPLTIYATGLGPTTGGKAVAGMPSPTSPLAVTGPLKLFFGNPKIKEAAIIVDWSGLAPGYIGVYQINCRIPGAHIKGDALPVTLRIGGVDSPITGPAAPVIYVE